MSGEIASNPELRQAWHQGLAGTLDGCIRTIVERAVDRGEIPADTDVELLAVLPLAVLQHMAAHERKPGDTLVARIVEQFYNPSPGNPARRRR